MLKRTHEDYVNLLNEKFDYIVPLGQYTNSQTNLEHKCLKCGYIWNPTPNRLLGKTNRGCPKCSKIERNKEATKTTKYYKEELIQNGRPFLCLGEYTGANIKTLHKCAKCEYEFMQTPHIILRTAVCPNCSNDINSTEKYREILKIRRPDIEVLEDYQGRDVKILHRHSCGYEFYITPNHILNNKNRGGCQGCFREQRKKTDEEFREQMKNNPLKILSKYNGSGNKLRVICPNGHIFEALPSNLLKGHGCRQCASAENGIRCRLTHDEYVNRMQEKFPNITVLSEYETSESPIRYRCTMCGIEAISNRAYGLLQNGCNCNRPSGEQVIAKYLSSRGEIFIPQIKFEGLMGTTKKLSYDFGLPQYKLLIEYQGAQHERPIEHFGGEEQFKTQQEYDRRKKEYADNNGYDILYIWYYDYDNIENILEECLKSKSVETAG